MTVHEFRRSYAYADEPEVVKRVSDILRHDMDAVRVERAEREDDRRGVDFWARLKSGQKQGVDLKRRKAEWSDLYLELVSNDGRNVVGWSKRDDYITDYVLFLWPKRHLLLPFPQLRATMHRQEAAYRERYGTLWAKSRLDGATWRTENVPVPEGVILRDMFGIGAPVGTPLTPPRVCPTCGAKHPVGTTCAGGWATWNDDALDDMSEPWA